MMAQPTILFAFLALFWVAVVSARNLQSSLEEPVPVLSRKVKREEASSIQYVIDALRTGNAAMAKFQLGKLPSEYTDAPETVIRDATKLLQTDTKTLHELFRLVASNNKNASLPQLAVNLLGSQKSEGGLEKVEDLITAVHIISQVLTQSSEDTTKGAEKRLLELIMSTLLRTLPSQNHQKWEEVNTWLGNDFYRVFKNLTKPEIFGQIVQSFEKEAGPILERYQLEYIEKRYYYCAESRAILDADYGEENSFNFAPCNEHLKSSTKIPPSLTPDVVNESKGENITATEVVEFRVLSVMSDYPTPGPTYNPQARRYELTINDENLWLSYVLDSVFNAVANGSIPFDPATSDKLFRILSPIKTSLSKYPTLTDLVKKTVKRIYERSRSDVHPVLYYLAELPDSLERLGTNTLVDLVTETKPRLFGDQAIILARQLAQQGLHNESVYKSLPEQARILAGLSDRKVVKWAVKVGNDVMDIYGRSDGTIGIRKPGTGSTKTATQLWAFKGRFVKGLTYEVTLIDSATEQQGNLAFIRRDGLKHELKSKRRSGNYAFFVNMTPRQDAFNLRYVTSKLPICIERNDNDIPYKLGECDEDNIEPANFILTRDPGADYKSLLNKLF